MNLTWSAAPFPERFTKRPNPWAMMWNSICGRLQSQLLGCGACRERSRLLRLFASTCAKRDRSKTLRGGEMCSGVLDEAFG